MYQGSVVRDHRVTGKASCVIALFLFAALVGILACLSWMKGHAWWHRKEIVKFLVEITL